MVIENDFEALDALNAGKKEQAFKYLVKNYSDKYFCFTVSKVLDPQDSEDIVQEVFINLFNKESYVDIRSLKDYMFIMLAHAINAYFKKQGLRAKAQRISQEQMNLENDQISDSFHVMSKVDAILLKMPAQRSKAYQLRHFFNMRHKQIAEVMRITERTVHWHLQLAEKELKIKLKYLR